jgi:hypothetical protein
MDWSEYLSWREAATYLLIVAVYAAVGVFLGQYLYPALGVSWSFLYRTGGRGAIAPFIFTWSALLFVLAAIPYLRKRFLLTSFLAFGGGTVLTIGVLWLASR